MSLRIESMKDSDWLEISRIYEEGIKTGNATFETSIPSQAEWDKNHLINPRLVARVDDDLLGWAALSPVSDRCVYGGVAEISVYVDINSGGKGIGFELLSELVLKSESEGIWTLQAGIFPENKASIALHKKCGFKILGIRNKLGKMNGVWRDVVFMERRSKVIGIE